MYARRVMIVETIDLIVLDLHAGPMVGANRSGL
jgi:hypothetical protein